MKETFYKVQSHSSILDNLEGTEIANKICFEAVDAFWAQDGEYLDLVFIQVEH